MCITASIRSQNIRVTQGHEVSGKIAALGEGVTGFAVGQKVTIEPQVYCGRCHPCTHGKYNLCEELRVMGFQTTGTASEYFAVDAGKVTPLPETMTYSEGAMIEPLAVTVHAVRRAGDVRGQKITVLGAGPIGIPAGPERKGAGRGAGAYHRHQHAAAGIGKSMRRGFCSEHKRTRLR